MAVALCGAQPVGADVDPDTGLVNPEAVAAAIGARTKALIAVHLFGRLAPMRELRVLADRHGLLLLEDAAQAHGAREGALAVETLGDAAAFSFYPTKLLGGLGEGGAVSPTTRSSPTACAACAATARAGRSAMPPRSGTNSRLDELQAAVLRERLVALEEDLARVRSIAGAIERRSRRQPTVGSPPLPADGEEPAWHQFVIRSPDRDALRAALASARRRQRGSLRADTTAAERVRRGGRVRRARTSSRVERSACRATRGCPTRTPIRCVTR